MGVPSASIPEGEEVEPQLSTEETQLYDRQIRLWGAQAQKRMMKSRVIVVGMSCTNVELAKNLILAGINVLLMDETSVKESDYGYNAFLDDFKPDAPVPSRAHGCHPQLQDLNSMVEVVVVPGSLSASLSDEKNMEMAIAAHKFTAICVAGEYHPLHTLTEFDALCRKMDVGLFVSLCCGKMGFFFSDMHSHEIKESEFDTSAKVVNFPSLSETLSALDDPTSYPKKTRDAFYSWAVLSAWETANEQEIESRDVDGTELKKCKLDGVCSTSEDFVNFGVAKFVKDKVLADEKDYQDTRFHLAELHRLYRRPFNLVASPLGGILAQEVRKYISGQHTPLQNCLAYSFFESVATVKLLPSPKC